MPALEFIHVTPTEYASDEAPEAIITNRRRIRSQAMKHFRRKERQQHTTEYVIGGTNDNGKKLLRNKSISTASPSLPLPLTVSTPTLWRYSFGQRMAEAWFPAGHRDSALRNIAYTYDMLKSAPIVTVQDALSLVHAGSAAEIDYLKSEARRRYVLVINLLRREVTRKTPEMPVARLGYLAMACLMCETYSAIAYGSGLIKWQKQVLGISALVATTQHDCFTLALDTFLFQQIRVAQLIYSLCERRPFPSRLTIQALTAQPDRLNTLLELAFQVPAILQAVDLAIAGDLQYSQSDLVKRLSVKERALSSWLTEFSVSDRKQKVDQSELAVDHSGHSTTPPDARDSMFNLTCETLCRTCQLLIVESMAVLEDWRWRSHSSTTVSNAYARDLRKTMTMLEEAADTPICKARVMSAPLYLLSGYHTRQEDEAGLRWCQETEEALRNQAPYLRWDALLPWCLLTLEEIPHYDADPYA